MAERYRYSVSDKEETGFVIASCIDTKTGLTVRTLLASDVRSYPAFIAYSGAKFSRDIGGLQKISREVETGYRDGILTPEKRLANIVTKLKHQSPAGMAHVAVVMEKLPIMTAATLFRTTTLHDGQEGSTRFINFKEGSVLPQLKNLVSYGGQLSPELLSSYQGMQDKSVELYEKWFEPVYDFYKEHFKIDENIKAEKDALTARTFDTIRGFLLSGFNTSMIYVANATTMQQVISNFGSDRLPGEKQLADGLLALLAPKEKIKGYSPEIMPLLNHTEPTYLNKNEQGKLRDYFGEQPEFKELLKKRRRFSGLVDNSCTLIPNGISQADQIVAQHILVTYPALKFEDTLNFAKNLTDEQKTKVGQIIFAGRDRFNLPSIAASTGSVDVDMKIDFGIERDSGRHRSFDRVSPIHETYWGMDEIPETGFTQAVYLKQIPGAESIQAVMEDDMLELYEQRDTFMNKLGKEVGKEDADRVGMYLLPLAHQVEMIMSGDPRYSVHFLDTRIRPGVHIDLRMMAKSWSDQLAARDPLYRTLAYPDNQVVVDDRDQFVRRD